MKGLRTMLGSIIAVGLLAGSVVGVAAQDGATAPVEFTATWLFGNDLRIGTEENVDGVEMSRGGAWRPQVVGAASDPRFQGIPSVAYNGDDYDAVGGPSVGHTAFRIQNDEGAWQQTPTVSMYFPGDDRTSETGVLVGEGGYEGLVAVVVIETDREAGTWVLHGYIIDGGLPPAPEPFITD